MRKFFTFLFLLFVVSLLNAQQITVVFPNGGEHFAQQVAAPHNIIWTAQGVTNFKVEYSTDNGVTWIEIANNVTDNFLNWSPPTVVSSECLIRVSDIANTVSDVSDASFSIVERHNYYIEWNTSMGVFRAMLHNDLVPITTQNFINLAERDFYNNLIFHRVIEGFMIQDGCPLGNGMGDPGYEFDNEIVPELTHSFPGVLAMANAGPNTNGSQYYITVDATDWLDGGYTIFGRIVDGMDVVYAISEVATDGNDKPLVDVNIYSVTINEANPQLSLVFPTGNSSIMEGNEIEIEWESDYVSDIKLEYSIDNGNNWLIIADSIPADYSSYLWIVPNTLSQNCFIRITDLSQTLPIVQNIEPFEIRVQPIKLVRFELYEGVEANSENPENFVQIGKPFRFKINVKNDLDVDLQDVSVVLSSNISGVLITENTINIGQISAQNQKWSDDYFEVVLPEEELLYHNITLSIAANDAYVTDIPWISNFNIPQLTLFSFKTVDDDNNPDSHGNNNKKPEYGETAELIIKVDNKSSDTVFQVHGQLRSDLGYINIWNDVQGYDRIVYDTTKFNNYQPLIPLSTSNRPVNDYVFDYNAINTYKIFFDLITTGYLYENQGLTWDEGGIKIIWSIPFTINNSYPVGIDEVIDNNEIEILGNPVENEIIFKFVNNSENFKTNIYNISGHNIYSKNTNYSETNTYKVSNIDLQSGIYFLVIQTNEKLYTKKIIVK